MQTTAKEEFFLKRLYALLMVTVLLLAGCSAGQSQSQPDKVLTDSQEVFLSFAAEPVTLDPAAASGPEAFAVLGSTMEGLLRLGPGGQLLPGVAEEWHEESGLRYTFRLRQNARWSDGRAVLAGDFRFAWLRALDPATTGPHVHQLYHIKGAEALHTLNPLADNFAERKRQLADQVAIEVVDDHTLRVTLEHPAPYWPQLTAFPTYYPARADLVEEFGARYGSGYGTAAYNGPFHLVVWNPGDRLVLKRNEHYWDRAAVKLNKVTWLFVPEPERALAMYREGALDRVAVPESLLARVREERQLVREAEPVTWYLVANTRAPLLADSRARRALALTVDRKGFATEVVGYAGMLATGLVPPSVMGARTRWEVGDSKEEARLLWQQALKEGGVEEKAHLRLLTPDSPRAERYARALADRLKGLPGVTAEVLPLGQRDLIQRLEQGDYELAFTGTVAEYNDPLSFLDLWVTGGALNDAGWADSQYDELIRRTLAEQSPEARAQRMAEAEQRLLEELPVIPLFHPVTYHMQQPWLKGLVLHPLGASPDLSRAYVDGKPRRP